jgi:hypothetical protein
MESIQQPMKTNSPRIATTQVIMMAVLMPPATFNLEKIVLTKLKNGMALDQLLMQKNGMVPIRMRNGMVLLVEHKPTMQVMFHLSRTSYMAV